MAQANRERWDLGGTQMETLLTEVARFKGESLWQDAWRRLKANRASWWALVFLAAFGSVSILAPVLPLFGRGLTKLQPVFVDEVAEACARALANSVTAGKVYELGGPGVYTYADLLRLVVERTGRNRLRLPVPFFVWEGMAALMAFLPNPPLTPDQVKLMNEDNVGEATALTLADLGITSTPVEDILPTYVNPDSQAIR